MDINSKEYQVIIFWLLIGIVAFLYCHYYPFLYFGIILGILSLFSKSFTSYFSKFYFTAGKKIGWIVSVVMLSTLFFAVLTPLAYLRRIFGERENFNEGKWEKTNKTFSEEHFNKPW